MLLAQHFFSNDVDQLMAEWHRFKFDLIDFQGAGLFMNLQSTKQIIKIITFAGYTALKGVVIIS